MNLFTIASASFSPGTIATIILGVLALSAFIGWMGYRVYKSAERAERDPRYLRRQLLALGVLYIGSAVYGIAEVVTGREPIESLMGLPIGALLAWFYLRLAFRVKVPPA
jgi:glucose uptake protein GlcU